MDQFLEAVQTLVDAAQASHKSRDEFFAMSRTVTELGEAASLAAREQALTLLRPAIMNASPSPTSMIAVVAGALVEGGASPDAVAEPVVMRLETLLQGAAPFIQAYLSTGTETERVPLTEFFETTADSMRESAGAWAGVPLFALSALTMLAFSETVRSRVLADGKLAAQIAPLMALDERLKNLNVFLKSAAPRPFIALHPASGQAYRLQMVGITDNFQLHTLLGDALVGDPNDGWLTGQRPDPASVAAAHGDAQQNAPAFGIFNLVSWYALRRDLTVSGNSDYWIWNEGTPDDIPLFEDQYVLLLTPPPYARSWFSKGGIRGLRAQVTLLEKLDAAAARALLDKVAQAAENRLADHPDTKPETRVPSDMAVGVAHGGSEDEGEDDLEIASIAPDLAPLFARSKSMLKSMPALADQLFDQGRSLVREGDFKNAEAIFNVILEVRPNASVYFYRGIARRRMDDFDGALSDYVAATDLDPTLFEAYVNRAPIHVRRGDYQAIVDDNTTALHIKPTSALAYNNRAGGYHLLGNYQAALADADRAIEIDSAPASFYNTRGEIYAALGDTVKAAQDFKQTLERNPNHAEAANMRNKLAEWGY